MGTDRDDFEHPCLCGAGTINVVRASPDHMWAKASQISYSAKLNCEHCAQTYALVDAWGNGLPYLALKSDVDARADAKADYWSLNKQFREHPLAKSLEPGLIAEIDQALAKSMAAAHRVLTHYRLTSDSISTYRKYPVDGAKAVASASGHDMARIGEMLAETEEHRAAFAKVRKKIDQAHADSYAKINAVKTGHPWLKL